MEEMSGYRKYQKFSQQQKAGKKKENKMKDTRKLIYSNNYITDFLSKLFP